MYSYVLNNPLRYIDPSGMDACQFSDGSLDNSPETGGLSQGDCEAVGGTWFVPDFTATATTTPQQSPSADEQADLLGSEWLQGTYDFGAGVLDDFTFGFSMTVFDWTGVGANINTCSTAFTAGQWTGFAASIAAGGGAGPLKAGILDAGKAGIEFSHFVPARVGRQIGGAVGAFIESKNALNGNWVTIARHYLQDPRRFPAKAIQAAAGPKLSPALAVLDRTPRLLVGTAAGTVYGAAGKALGTSCR
jgi:hypothetical protein